jgi:hypothetical protein
MGLPENRRILLKSGVYVREEKRGKVYHVRSNSLGEVEGGLHKKQQCKCLLYIVS